MYEIPYSDFINRKLILFSRSQWLTMSAPSCLLQMASSLKVIWACSKWKLKKETKVESPFVIPYSSTILILLSSVPHVAQLVRYCTSLSMRHIIMANRAWQWLPFALRPHACDHSSCPAMHAMVFLLSSSHSLSSSLIPVSFLSSTLCSALSGLLVLYITYQCPRCSILVFYTGLTCI